MPSGNRRRNMSVRSCMTVLAARSRHSRRSIGKSPTRWTRRWRGRAIPAQPEIDRSATGSGL